MVAVISLPLTVRMPFIEWVVVWSTTTVKVIMVGV
jgi:hypothetical protein